MQWSKTKSTVERFLCDKLKGRIKIHATVYRKAHDGPSRIWFTFDKKEILSASDITYAVKHQTLYQQIKEEHHLKAIPFNEDWRVMLNCEERQKLVKASNDVDKFLLNQNIFESHHLYAPLMEYSSLSIDEAINSENIIIRAYSMLDRRLGKRRLEKIAFTNATNPLIVECYKIRCSVEGITPHVN